MIKNNSVCALIPARGGSKGLPHKAIASLNAKPLIAYTIEAALKSVYIDKIVVSTDNDKIADVAKKHGAEIPFMRPPEISADDSSAMEYIDHALDFFANNGEFFPDITMILQPTSPLRTVEDIDKALELIINSQAKSLVSLYHSEISPYWFKKVNNNNFISDFIQQPSNYIRRQDTDNLYLLNGAIFIIYSNHFLSGKILVDHETIAYIMPPERSVDIDTMLDLQFAEFLLKRDKT